MIQITFIIVRRKRRAGKVKWPVIELNGKQRIIPKVLSCQPSRLLMLSLRLSSVDERTRGRQSAYTWQGLFVQPQQRGFLPFKLNSFPGWSLILEWGVSYACWRMFDNWLYGGELICNICPFLWCKFQAYELDVTEHEFKWRIYNQFLLAGMSWFQHFTGISEKSKLFGLKD